MLPHYSRAQRKAWSHLGATTRSDLGNRTYKLVVHVTQLLRQRLGLERLYQIDQLCVEKAGDVVPQQLPQLFREACRALFPVLSQMAAEIQSDIEIWTKSPENVYIASIVAS